MDKFFTRWTYIDGDSFEENVFDGWEKSSKLAGEDVLFLRPKVNLRFVSYKIRNGVYVLTSVEHSSEADFKTGEISRFRDYVFHRADRREDYEDLPQNLLERMDYNIFSIV